MKKIAPISISFLLILSNLIFAGDPLLESSKKTTEEWLKLIDQKKYNQAYPLLHPQLRSKVSEQKWIEATEQIRSRYEKVVERKFHRQFEFKAPTRLPKGEYLQLEFKTQFKKLSALEIIIIFKNQEDRWTVMSYGIQEIFSVDSENGNEKLKKIIKKMK